MLFLRMARTWLYAAASLEGRLIRPAADQFFGHPTVRHECCCGHSTKTVRQNAGHVWPRPVVRVAAVGGLSSGCGRWTLLSGGSTGAGPRCPRVRLVFRGTQVLRNPLCGQAFEVRP